MGIELSYVLINPYTIRKSRTGGVIARYCARTGLKLAGARFFGASQELAERYSLIVREADPNNVRTCGLLADYILREYAPDKTTGKPHRSLLLLFEGENAIAKTWDTTGSSTLFHGSGLTVRDTYGDYITKSDGSVRYFEPAVLVAPDKERAKITLRLWAEYSEKCGGIVGNAEDVPHGLDVERTLVMLKPDNFRYPSLRPGNIIDVLSASGLRIVGAKKFAMTMSQAEQFYGPVKESLEGVFARIGGGRMKKAITGEFGFAVSDDEAVDLCKKFGRKFAEQEFENIVEYITGHRPSECDPALKDKVTSESCLALVYEGVDAVRTIRDILGPTDPSKAQPGSVRKEFGSNIMVNAAHASDSPENAKREMDIIDVQEDAISPMVKKYYG